MQYEHIYHVQELTNMQFLTNQGHFTTNKM